MSIKAKLLVGKLRSTGSLRPWEPGYVEQIRSSMADLNRIIADVCKQFEDITPEICYDALEPTLNKAISYTPIDTGALRASAYLEITGFRGQPRVEMGFARGGDPYYAVLVHEDLGKFHKYPTRAKFLEVAVKEDADTMSNAIIQSYKKWFGGDGNG